MYACTSMYIHMIMYIYIYTCVCMPIVAYRTAVPHKAVEEVSRIGHYSIGDVSCCDAWMEERTHCWTQRWLELCFF